MNRQQAKRILIAYRPGIDDASDTEINEALRWAETDPELKAWLDNQSAWHAAIRVRLNEIPVPPDLGRQILAERKVLVPFWRRREFLAVAAVVALLLVLPTFWFPRAGEEQTFAAFRSRMVRFARREYRMDIVTSDAMQVREFLVKRGGPADFTLTRGLESRPVMGAAKLTWQGHPVSMVCFSAPTSETLYLFVLDRAAVREGALPGSTPAIVPAHRLNAAGWSRGDKIYLLAAPLDERELRKLL